MCKSLNRSWSNISRSLNRASALAVAVALSSVSLQAVARGLVPPGLYEITVTQELPNVVRAAPPVTTQACLTNQLIGSGAAFHVRSDNPVRDCPLSDLRVNDDELIYRVICPQPNSPRGKAKFLNTKTGYQGAITIDMGGKNMLMTERHQAKRIGECAEAISPYVERLDAEQIRARQRLSRPENWTSEGPRE